MATKRTNGRKASGNLKEAVAVLINNQAQFMGHIARIDDRLSRIEQLLLDHHQMLVGLPEAIRQKIGFKPGFLTSRRAPEARKNLAQGVSPGKRRLSHRKPRQGRKNVLTWCPPTGSAAPFGGSSGEKIGFKPRA